MCACCVRVHAKLQMLTRRVHCDTKAADCALDQNVEPFCLLAMLVSGNTQHQEIASS